MKIGSRPSSAFLASSWGSTLKRYVTMRATMNAPFGRWSGDHWSLSQNGRGLGLVERPRDRPARERDRLGVVRIRQAEDEALDAGVEHGAEALGDLVGRAQREDVAEPLGVELHPVRPGGEALLGFLARLGDRDRPQARARDLRRVASDVGAVRVENAHQVTGPLCVAEDVARVRMLRDETERLPLAAAADQDRDVPAQRAGIVQHALDAKVAA